MTDEPRSDAAPQTGGESELVEAARRQADEARQAAQQGGETHTSPAASPPVDAAFASHRPPPDSFPGYEIVREIHRGGQGVVYQAIQKATKRKVAIKVMHEGPFAGARDKARFEREVQILAALKHPNIVGIHDSGSAAGGFYYVMDYISGLPLDAYMQARSDEGTKARREGTKGPRDQGIEETLRLFAKICEAVNSAHLKGVIHRDLKPGNIRIDSNGEPHVLDFGLAKLATGEVTDASRPQVMTMTGQFIGSMPWASPEQAEGLPDKIDIRTDVYSLGVILYQMLTDHFPYEVVGNMRDVLDNILRAEPAKPSTIRRQINDEVETIVLKCLAKERERRYQSAGELGRDIVNYLAGQPIEAKRDSAIYILRKQFQRHRRPVIAALSFVFLLAASSVALTLLYRQARRQATIAQYEQARALAAERQQSLERERAEEQARIATAERKRAEIERDAAIAARDEAGRARAEVKLEQRRADEQQGEARWQSYFATIKDAESSFHAGEIALVHRKLDAAPVDLRNWEWRYLSAQCDQSLATLRDHNGLVGPIAFSPDGTCLAVTSMDGAVRIRDARTGMELAKLPASYPRTWISDVAFSPDGRRLASASQDKIVRLWDTASGVEMAALQGHEDAISSVAFSPDGKRLASGSHDRTAKLWDAASGAQVATLRGHEGGVDSLAFSPNGSRLATGSTDKTVKLWDPVRAVELATLRGHEDSVSSVAFSPDGTRLATGSLDKTVKLWDPASSAEVATRWRHEGPVWSVAFSPDGTWVASCSRDGPVKCWDPSGVREAVTLRGHKGPVARVIFSPSNSYMASGSHDGTLKLWEVPARADVASRPTHCGSQGTPSVVFSADGASLASNFFLDDPMSVWGKEPESWFRIHMFNIMNNIRASCTAFSADWTKFATGSSDGLITIRDMADGEVWATLQGHIGAVHSLAFSPDSNRVVSGSHDKTIGIWDAASGSELGTLRGHEETVASVAFSPDGKRIASGSLDKTVKIWDAMSGTELATLRGHEREVDVVVFSPDGTRLASGSRDRTVRLWDATSGRELTTLRGHESAVNALSFSPDGTRIVSGSADKTLRLWDVAHGQEVGALHGHKVGITSVAFSPDGTRIASCSSDCAAILWDSLPASIRAAMPAQQLVDGVLDQLGDPMRVAQHLQRDASLSGEMRSAASVALLRRGFEISAEASQLVDRLSEEVTAAEEVVAQVRDAPSLSKLLRACALDLVQRRAGNPSRLNKDSWLLVSTPGNEIRSYKQAVRWAEEAAAVVPDIGEFQNTLGVAYYRVGEYGKALETLACSDRLNSASGRSKGGTPADVAFLAMSLHQLGRTEEARAALERLRGLMQDPRYAEDEESQGFLREAEALIRRTPGSQPQEAEGLSQP